MTPCRVEKGGCETCNQPAPFTNDEEDMLELLSSRLRAEITREGRKAARHLLPYSPPTGAAERRMQRMAYHMNEEVQRLNRRGVHPRDLWGVISFSCPNPSLDPTPAGSFQAPRSPPSEGEEEKERREEERDQARSEGPSRTKLGPRGSNPAGGGHGRGAGGG